MDKRKIKLIALDLDDTTLKSDGSLAEETKSALERAVKMGIEIVIASGRAFTALPKEVIDIPGINYAVTLNGSSVYSLKDKKKMASFILYEEAVIKLLEIQKPYGDAVAVEVFVEGVPYTSCEHVNDPEKHGCSPAYVDYVRRTRIPVENLEKFIIDNKRVIDSFVVVCPEKEIRGAIKTEINNNITGIKITSSVRHLMEIIHEKAGKDTGLKLVCEMLNVAPEEVVACGNADNDIAMMQFAGTGVAVSNGSKRCIEAADIVIENNNDNSVAKLINEICNAKQVAF